MDNMPDNSDHSLPENKSGASDKLTSSAASSTGTAAMFKGTHSLYERHLHGSISGNDDYPGPQWRLGMQDPDVLREQDAWEEILRERQRLSHDDHTVSRSHGQAPQDHQRKSSPETPKLEGQGAIAKPNVDKTVWKALPKDT